LDEPSLTIERNCKFNCALTFVATLRLYCDAIALEDRNCHFLHRLSATIDRTGYTHVRSDLQYADAEISEQKIDTL